MGGEAEAGGGGWGWGWKESVRENVITSERCLSLTQQLNTTWRQCHRLWAQSGRWRIPQDGHPASRQPSTPPRCTTSLKTVQHQNSVPRTTQNSYATHWQVCNTHWQVRHPWKLHNTKTVMIHTLTGIHYTLTSTITSLKTAQHQNSYDTHTDRYTPHVDKYNVLENSAQDNPKQLWYTHWEGTIHTLIGTQDTLTGI